MATNAGPSTASNVVVQDEFSSDSDREEFRQAVTGYGITFLRCSDAPLPQPSEDDLKIIKKLVDACKLLEIAVLDHLIIGQDQFYSFADEGTM